MTRLRICVLGPLLVTRDDTPVTGFESDKMRALLAYLVLEADRPHRREALAALLWPEQTDAAARQSLRQALYILRQILSGILLVTRQTVQFQRASDTWCDVWLFRRLLAACQAHSRAQAGHPARCRECLDRLRQATELYRGDFLQGFLVDDSREFEEWMLMERETYHRQMLGALGWL